MKYFNASAKENALFYPDWILKFRDGRIGIFDSKSGFTAQNSEGRAEGLASKLFELNEDELRFIGGLVVLENNQWYYSASLPYEYTSGKLTRNWDSLENIF